MKVVIGLVLLALQLLGGGHAWIPSFGRFQRVSVSMDMAQVGIFFGTSTGSTEKIADLIKEQFGDDADGPMDVETLEGSVEENFARYPSLVVGTPTWNTGADTERSGTGWDEIYYSSMQKLNLQGKKVAVFGLGDQISYSENYADAAGELHDVFQALGAEMIGYTSQEGYEHENSKSIRGDQFCGLLCDEVNQEELSEERVQNWVAQLKDEGILQGDATATAPTAVASSVFVPDIQQPIPALTTLEENSKILEGAIQSHSNGGFTPYYNAKTRSTMWVSLDGRSCYYTSEPMSSTAGISP